MFRIARAFAAAVARAAGNSEEIVEDLKLAVTELLGLAASETTGSAIGLQLYTEPDEITIATDLSSPALQGDTNGQSGTSLRLAVIRGLCSSIEVDPNTGRTELRIADR